MSGVEYLSTWLIRGLRFSSLVVFAVFAFVTTSQTAFADCGADPSPPGGVTGSAILCDGDPADTVNATALSLANFSGLADSFTIQSFVSGASVVTEDTLTGTLFMFGGNDIVIVQGGEITGSIDAGGGEDSLVFGIPAGADPTPGGIPGPLLGAGIVQGSVIGGGNDDTITIFDADIGGDVEGDDSSNLALTGDDLIQIFGGTIGGNVLAGPGNDTVQMADGDITGNVDLGDGGDDFVIIGGRIGGNLLGGLGADALEIFGGIIEGDIDLGPGDNDTLLLAALSSLNLPTVDSEISGGDGAGDGLVIDNSDFDTPLVFSGWESVNVQNDSTVTLSSLAHSIDALTVDANSTLRFSGPTFIGPSSAPGSTLDLDGVLDSHDGSAGDVLTVGTLNLSNSTKLLLEFGGSGGAIDAINVDALTLTGPVPVQLASVGSFDPSGGVAAFLNVAGETAPDQPTAGQTPVQSEDFVFDPDSTVGSPIFDFYILSGSSGGGYLAWAPNATAAGDDIGPSLHNERLALDDRIESDLTDIINSEVNGLGRGLPSHRLSRVFKVWASGRLAYREHQGMTLRSSSGKDPYNTTPDSEAREYSILGGVQFDLAKMSDAKAYGLKAGVFGGWAKTDVDFLSNPELTALGYIRTASGESETGLVGGYALATVRNLYLLGQVTGNWGESDIEDHIFQSKGSYDTDGYSVGAIGGIVLPLDDRLKVDLRAAFIHSELDADAFTDSIGTEFGNSDLESTRAIFSATFFSLITKNSLVVKPYLEVGFDQRLGFETTAKVGNVALYYEDDDTRFFSRAGLLANAGEKLTLFGSVRGDGTEDQWSISGQLGAKVKLN